MKNTYKIAIFSIVGILFLASFSLFLIPARVEVNQPQLSLVEVQNQQVKANFTSCDEQSKDYTVNGTGNMSSTDQQFCADMAVNACVYDLYSKWTSAADDCRAFCFNQGCHFDSPKSEATQSIMPCTHWGPDNRSGDPPVYSCVAYGSVSFTCYCKS